MWIIDTKSGLPEARRKFNKLHRVSEDAWREVQKFSPRPGECIPENVAQAAQYLRYRDKALRIQRTADMAEIAYDAALSRDKSHWDWE